MQISGTMNIDEYQIKELREKIRAEEREKLKIGDLNDEEMIEYIVKNYEFGGVIYIVESVLLKKIQMVEERINSGEYHFIFDEEKEFKRMKLALEILNLK